MERYDRDRYDRGGYNNENRYNNDNDNYRNRYDREDRYDNDRDNRYGDSDRYDRFDRDDRRGRELKQQFEREYRRDHNDNYSRNSDNDRFSDRDRSSDYRSRDYDMERNYYSSTRGDGANLGDVRQGYGISSFTGTSDRYNTLSDMERNRNQREQGYGTGRLGGYSGSRFGGANYSAHGDFGGSSDYGSMSGSGGNMDRLTSSSGYGYSNSSGYSDRGQPDYSTSNFENRYGAGMGDTYSGTTRYSDGNRGGSGNSYGSSSGNGGYGSGRTSILDDDRYSANSDRGGYVNRDPNRDR